MLVDLSAIPIFFLFRVSDKRNIPRLSGLIIILLRWQMPAYWRELWDRSDALITQTNYCGDEGSLP